MAKAARPAWCFGALSAAAVLVICASAVGAEQAYYTPVRADEVLERLPRSMTDTDGALIKRLHQQLDASPEDVSLAVSLATLYIEKGRTQSDPRYFGYAQAALAPWWQAVAPPVPVRVARAEIAQWQHAFDQAIADLLAVVRKDSRNARAWLLLANTYLVQGRTHKAAAACSALAKTANQSIASLCYAGVMNRTGRAAQSYALLQVEQRQFQSGALLQWLLTTQAEAALMQGHAAQAERAFARAMTTPRRDPYLLAAYADFLLDEQRYAEVLALLRREDSDQSLLLRSAIAAKKLGDESRARKYREQLRAYFSAERSRGGQPHNREAALFELELEGDGEQALRLARANWDLQREPIDARILLRAARARGDADTVAAVGHWLAARGMQDVRLSRLLEGAGLETVR